jgi:hypothetical protein
MFQCQEMVLYYHCGLVHGKYFRIPCMSDLLRYALTYIVSTKPRAVLHILHDFLPWNATGNIH